MKERLLYFAIKNLIFIKPSLIQRFYNRFPEITLNITHNNPKMICFYKEAPLWLQKSVVKSDLYTYRFIQEPSQEIQTFFLETIDSQFKDFKKNKKTANLMYYEYILSFFIQDASALSLIRLECLLTTFPFGSNRPFYHKIASQLIKSIRIALSHQKVNAQSILDAITGK